MTDRVLIPLPGIGTLSLTKAEYEAALMQARAADRNELPTTPPVSPCMRMGDVMKMPGLTSSKIYELVREGEFPKWANLPKIASEWLRSDVEAWMLARRKSSQ